ncbi:MAG: hypothetical protein INR71_01385 [Terriglobus roseus]|nr:hypothetical protein [Terriglobus roseus]
MRPFRLLLSLTSCVLAITFLLYLSIADPSERATDPSDDESSKGGLGALFSFHGPLFPPSAIISLTDDNSTFFLARPAAFGPPLPSRGLSGELWIGNGFADNVYARGTFESSAEGELGCSDVPGWDEEYGLASRAGRVKTRSRHGPRPHRNIGARTEKLEAERWERSMLDDALHQTADIEGKIVLLSRGGCGFLDKVQWAQRRGGTAVVIGDNVRSGPIIRMYARGDTSNVSIPALFTSRTTAHLLSTLVPSDQSTSFFTKTRPYGGIHWDGQSAAAETHGAADTSQVGWFEWLFSSLGLSGKRHGVEAADGKRPASAELSIAGAKSRARVLRSRYYAAGSSRAYPTTSHVVHTQSDHEGLWVTLTPTSMSSNPFLDTLLVLVVSPLVTLTVVYALLLLRSRLQRRRWRAPKSIVERLPVRTYHTLPTASPSSVATPVATSPATPLLQNSHRRLSDASGPEAALPPEEHDTSVPSHQEKQQSSLSEWRRKFRGRQRECVVCLEEYEDGVSRVMSLPCGHEFHAECM